MKIFGTLDFKGLGLLPSVEGMVERIQLKSPSRIVERRAQSPSQISSFEGKKLLATRKELRHF